MKNFIIYDLETEENYTIIVDGENTEDSDSEHDVIIQEQQDKDKSDDKESNEYYSAFVGLLIIVIIVWLCRGRRR